MPAIVGNLMKSLLLLLFVFFPPTATSCLFMVLHAIVNYINIFYCKFSLSKKNSQNYTLTTCYATTPCSSMLQLILWHYETFSIWETPLHFKGRICFKRQSGLGKQTNKKWQNTLHWNDSNRVNAVCADLLDVSY